MAIENARLFKESQAKSEQLAEASKLKSQFLANMSHEAAHATECDHRLDGDVA